MASKFAVNDAKWAPMKSLEETPEKVNYGWYDIKQLKTNLANNNGEDVTPTNWIFESSNSNDHWRRFRDNNFLNLK